MSLKQADFRIVADTMVEMRAKIEELTGARHSMYDGAVGIAKDLAAAPAPTVSGGEGWEELERAALAVLAYEPAADRATTRAEEAALSASDSRRRGQLNTAFQKAANPEAVLALIAVARGGFSALQASPSVPTEGEDAAWSLPVALRQARYVLRDLHVKHGDCGYGKLAQACEAAADRLVPTVQAETAVVGDPEVFRDLAFRLRTAEIYSVGSQDHELGNLLLDAARVVDFMAEMTAKHPPVSTGEQPGMSEGESPIWTAERQVGAAVYERIERLMDGVIGGEVASELAYLSHLVESVGEVGDYDGPPEGQPSPFSGQDGYEAQPSALTLPDDLLSLSEAATQGEWVVEKKNATAWVGPRNAVGSKVGLIVFDVDIDPAYSPEFIDKKLSDAALIVASVNFIRTLAAKQGGKS